MAATLSIQDYLNHFLFNRDNELMAQIRRRMPSSSYNSKPSSPVRRLSDTHLHAPTKPATPTPLQNYGLMLAHVYQIVNGGREKLVYSKKIEGHKSMDVFGIFVQDMIGTKGLKASQFQDGRISRGSSVSDLSSIGAMDMEEGHLHPNTTVVVQLLSSRSPSNIGSSQLLGLLAHCKRGNIRINCNLKFAHAYTWDNKYNREGLESLSAKGIKLSSVSFSYILQSIFDDIKEDLDSLDQLQTCRGKIRIKSDFVERALSTLRQSITIRSDFYHQDQHDQLQEILGRITDIPQYKKFDPTKLPATFSLETYRECILLQNMEIAWTKIKVTVAKVTKGVTKEDTVFETVLSSTERRTQGKNHTLKITKQDLDMESIWKKVGSKVTMADLSESDQIVLTVNALISEYNGHNGWVEEITQLHEFLRDKSEESEIYKVCVETMLRYANSTEAPIRIQPNGNKSLNNHTSTNGVKNGLDQMTLGFPRGMKVECIRIQDILFEMLEDLEDNIRHLGELEFARGANLDIDKEGVACAMGLLNKALKIRTAEGEFSMNDDFLDEYAEDMNRV